jgi:hypothetical protein
MKYKEAEMMKKVLVTIAGMLLLSAPAMAIEIPEGTSTAIPAYNCDYEPSCEVAPGIYGKMASPVTSKFNLSIGGYVALDYAYNSQNMGSNGFVYPTAPGGGLSPVGSLLAQERQSQFSARDSRFWLKVGGPTFLGAKTNALIEADFLGSNQGSNEVGNLRLRHAYGSLDWTNTQVLFGQFWDIFGPASAGTLDFRHGATTGTPNNPRVAQLRLTQKIPFNDDNSLKLVVGVQNPVQENINTAGGQSSGEAPNAAAQIMFVSKSLGVAPGAFGLSLNSLQAGFFGLWGTQKMTIVSAVNLLNKNVDVYGYGFYGFIPILKSKDGKTRAMTASLETQAYISAGNNWDGANGSTNLTFADAGATAPPTGTQSLYLNHSAAKGYGAYGQVIFYPIQDMGITTGYMRRNAMNYRAFESTAAHTFEKYNELYYANVTYDLNAAVKVGVEYEHGKTQYGGHSFGNNVAGNPLGDWGQVNIVRTAFFYFF